MKQLAFFIAGLLVLMVSACSSGNKADQTGPPPIPVKIGKPPLQEDYETVSVSGTISSPDEPSRISFLVSGKVIKVVPREGEYVRKGALLAAIDQTDYQLALTAATAQTATARIALERTEDEHRRMKMLYDSKSLAPNDYQKFKTAWESAGKQYRQALASEQISGKRLADAMLYAPLNGFISKRSIEPGETAIPGQPVFEIVQLDPVEVSVGIPETDVALVHAGQKAPIVLPALPGESFEGTVRLVNVSADPSTRTFMTRIQVPNPKHLLRIGMVAQCQIRTDRRVKMLTLPIGAIVRDPQGATIVYLYYPDQQRAYSRRVETGVLYGTGIEIKQGLNGEESVILAGQERLRDGAAVSVTMTDAQEHKAAAPEKGSRQ